MRWPPYRHVIFDCDSTLAGIEGIDALATLSGKGWRVKVLTDAAMEGEIELGEVYAKRLNAINPTRGQIQELRRIYKQNVVPGAIAVIEALKTLGHEVYVISGGLAEPVVEFGLFLGVPKGHIRAVIIEYDRLTGNWWQQLNEEPNVDEKYLSFDEKPLTISDGKAQIIEEILRDQTGRSLLIGDGVSDLLASRAVDLFAGFGGVVTRARVEAEAPVFISSQDISPILPVAAGPAGLKQLEKLGFSDLTNKVVDLIYHGTLRFQSEQLEDKFSQAWYAAYQAFYPRSN
jgi:phosphoserine phosphatase